MRTFPVIYLQVCFLLVATLFFQNTEAQKMKNDSFLLKMLNGFPDKFGAVLSNLDEWNIQVIYSEINRDKKNRVSFTDHVLNSGTPRYYYPASTVKLPVAVLALQRLHELKIPGLDMHSPFVFLPGKNTKSTDWPPPYLKTPAMQMTIADCVKRILLTSDNEAFNCLYDFLGQEYITENLQKMGYKEVQVLHRLNWALSEEENRYSHAMNFMDSKGTVVYHQPERVSKMIYTQRNDKQGKGFMRGNQLISEPFDFSRKNRLSLSSMHSIVRSLMFPESVAPSQRFGITTGDLQLVRRYMSLMPFESTDPKYDRTEYWDAYVKFLYYGSEKGSTDPGIRIFNKVGDAYGFLIDAAYFVDYSKNVEFMLSAVIHCNQDGIFNDDKYDYDTMGYPFMKNLGRMIYDYEIKRKKKRSPDLSIFNIEKGN